MTEEICISYVKVFKKCTINFWILFNSIFLVLYLYLDFVFVSYIFETTWSRNVRALFTPASRYD
jgi:hypothetical protein